MDELYDKIKLKIYYWLIFIISFIALVILPLLTSDADISWGFPSNINGWLVWGSSRLIISVLNVLIFHCFVKQADLNTENNELRVNAERKLSIRKNKQYTPLSPKEFFKKEYKKKIPTLAISTAGSLVAFGPVILKYDFAVFLTYIIVIVMGVVFGVLEMKRVETYYTKELPMYAEYLEKMEENNEIES